MTNPAAKKRRYQRSIRRAVFPPLITMAVLGFFLILQVGNLQKASRQVDQSNVTITQATKALKHVIDMETGMRGYLLSRNRKYLEPYHEGKSRVDEEFNDLTEAVRNNPELAATVETIHKKFQTWVIYSESVIAMRSRGNNRYLEIFDSGTGKERMDSIRDLFEIVIDRETATRDERNREAQKSAAETTGIVFVAMILAGLGLSWNGRHHMRYISREYEGVLAEEEQARERLATTLSSIGDAVIVTDIDSRITMINAVTEELTGWRSEEAIGKDAAEVFAIYDERTGETAGSPIEQVLREKRIVLLANHTVLRSRDQREIVIEDSAAPIRDAKGELTGVVLVFRDVTERKLQELAVAQVAERERRIAETLQRAMLLAPGQHAFTGLTVVTHYEAAWDDAQIGGDFHDAFPLEDGKVALVVGDVMGKGLIAAARTAEVKYALRVILRNGDDCASALARLNRTLLVGDMVSATSDADFEDDNRMVALAVAVIDPSTGLTNVAAAGAEPPMVARTNGAVEVPVAHGVLLGAAQEMEYEAVTLQLNPGDLLLMVTDGITEAHLPGSDLFGQERLISAYQEAVQSHPSIDDAADSIVANARAFAGGTFHDDVCLLLARLETLSAASEDFPTA